MISDLDTKMEEGTEPQRYPSKDRLRQQAAGNKSGSRTDDDSEEHGLQKRIQMTEEKLSGFFQFLEERQRGEGTLDSYYRNLRLLWEYLRLLSTAKLMGRERTYFIIKTICCAGVRVQELSQIPA